MGRPELHNDMYCAARFYKVIIQRNYTTFTCWQAGKLANWQSLMSSIKERRQQTTEPNINMHFTCATFRPIGNKLYSVLFMCRCALSALVISYIITFFGLFGSGKVAPPLAAAGQRRTSLRLGRETRVASRESLVAATHRDGRHNLLLFEIVQTYCIIYMERTVLAQCLMIISSMLCINKFDFRSRGFKHCPRIIFLFITLCFYILIAYLRHVPEW